MLHVYATASILACYFGGVAIKATRNFSLVSFIALVSFINLVSFITLVSFIGLAQTIAVNS